MRTRQKDFLTWGTGLMIHFGPFSCLPNYGRRKFLYEGKTVVDPALFHPDKLDFSDMLNLRGFGYAILTTKHEDGYCMWPTQTTSPHADRDYVGEFVAGCRVNKLRVGLYYNLHNLTVTGNDLDHIRELLTNYGQIDYLFFDGCGADKAPHDYQAIGALIRELQPEIILSNGLTADKQLFYEGEPDVGWIGNEDGIIDTKQRDDIILSAYIRVRRSYWYFVENIENTDRLKTPEELYCIYGDCRAAGVPLVINIGPDTHGEILKSESRLLREFHKLTAPKAKSKTKTKDIASGASTIGG